MAALIGTGLYADRPCQDQAKAKENARKSLHACVEAWAKDRKATDADPTDDCSAKLSAYIQAAKDAKACHAQQKH